MDLKEAEKVVTVYGEFLSWNYDRLDVIFFGNKPESFLPFSLECIEVALNMVAKSYHDLGDYKKSKVHQDAISFLYGYEKDEEVMLKLVQAYKNKEMYDVFIGFIKGLRDKPGQKLLISSFFKDRTFESVDFHNLDFYSARQAVDIYATFLKYAHMRLNCIFCEQIPESLLPFPKENIIKAVTFYKNMCELTGNKEDADTWTFGKDVLEDYIDDEVAINQLIENFSDKEIRDSIIFGMKALQQKCI